MTPHTYGAAPRHGAAVALPDHEFCGHVDSGGRMCLLGPDDLLHQFTPNPTEAELLMEQPEALRGMAAFQDAFTRDFAAAPEGADTPSWVNGYTLAWDARQPEIDRLRYRIAELEGGHKPTCPRAQFWDAGEFEAPCTCDL